MASSSSPVTLIVGLGNPGPQYARNRHNVGFWLVDRIGDTRRDARYDADLGATTIGGARIVLMKPMSYMNRSGGPVGAYLRFFKIEPCQVLVVHDDLDLAPGVVRLKQGGGHGGHNGLRDLTAQIGSDFKRLRIGIGHPGSAPLVTNYVLGNPSPEDRAAIEQAIERALERLADLVGGRFELVMNELNRRDGEPARGQARKD
ncbi:MAG TPA: aminoacyl-tRNA hydrolase [Gammaproteobacteria bacterium]|nr:aminoacyl-tRNA hydrolase [Gammaproteobacteria bacterium]